MKDRKTLLIVSACVVLLVVIFGWLFWGSNVPGRTTNKDQTKAGPKITNSTISRTENGKKIWEFTVGEAESVDNGKMIKFKDIKGTIYMTDGDEMHLKAAEGSAQTENNDFSLGGGVTADLLKGGSLVADKITWKQKEDILTALGKVKIIHEDTMAKAEQIITSTKLTHFKLHEKALIEKGGKYDEE
jgi:LPS export ABC transporter protein LptC